MTVSKISPTIKQTPTSKIATISAGCFWGVERIYKNQFKEGIVDLKVGYANGNADDYRNPDYATVKSGVTNFAESLQISYEPSIITYRQLVELFFRMHDPTHLNHQGHDYGTQYRSLILVESDEEANIAHEELEKAQKVWYPNHEIVTKVETLQSFFDAEDYHQRYFEVHPEKKGCPTHFVRTIPKK